MNKTRAGGRNAASQFQEEANQHRIERWLADTRTLIQQLPGIDNVPHSEIRMLLRAVARCLDKLAPELAFVPLAGEEPPRIKIRTLGRFSIERDGKPLTFSHKLPRKPLDLLMSLIAHGGRAVSEVRIAEDLWPDADGATAQQSFSVTLHRLRRLLDVREAIEVRNAQVTLDAKTCWVDVWAFERSVDEIDHRATVSADPEEAGVERFDQTLDLYQGPFVPHRADAWLLPMRERLRSKFIRSVRTYTERCERIGQRELAVRIYERAIEIDPHAEELYRRLMNQYGKLGHIAEAVSVYRRCRMMLAKLLGVEPSAETNRQYMSLLQQLPAERGGGLRVDDQEVPTVEAGSRSSELLRTSAD